MTSAPNPRKRKRLEELAASANGTPTRVADTSIVPETVLDSLSQVPLSQIIPPAMSQSGSSSARVRKMDNMVNRMRQKDGSPRQGEPHARTQTHEASERSILPRADDSMCSSKPLGPIPVVSPSRFKPYLSNHGTPPSSIERFSSPEKDRSDEVVEADVSWEGRGPTRDALRQGIHAFTQGAQRPRPSNGTMNGWLQDRNRRRPLAELVSQSQPSAGHTTSVPETPRKNVESALASVRNLTYGETRKLDFVAVNGSQRPAEESQSAQDGDDGPVAEDDEAEVEGELADTLTTDPDGRDSQPPVGDSMQALPSSGVPQTDSQSEAQVPSQELYAAFDNFAHKWTEAEAAHAAVHAEAQEMIRTLRAASQTKDVQISELRAQIAANKQTFREAQDRPPSPSQAEFAKVSLELAESQRLLDECAVRISELEQAFGQSMQTREHLATELGTAKSQAAEAIQARSSTNAELARVQARLVEAENTIIFWRGRYAKVDEFADCARKELVTLREEAAVARSQATDGVSLVRGTLEGRIARLEEDLRRAVAQNVLLREKDTLITDDVRRRAAECEEALASAEGWRAQAEAAHREAERLQVVIDSMEDGSFHGSDSGSDSDEERTPVPEPHTSYRDGNPDDLIWRCLVRSSTGATCNAIHTTRVLLYSHVEREHALFARSVITGGLAVPQA